MADNVNITAGAGTTIATDQVGTDHYQKVKLTDGTADSSTMIVAGGGVEAAALRVTIASDSTGVVSIDDNGGAITVDGTVAVTNAGITSIDGKITACNTGAVVVASGVITADTELTTADLDTGAGTDTRAVVGLVGTASGGGQLIPGSSTDGLLINLGTNNDVTITSGTVTAVTAITNALPAGDNNIGNVDIVTIPAPLSVVGTGTEATALRVTIASDSTGVLSVDDNASSLTVDQAYNDNLCCNANIQVGDTDVAVGNAVPVKSGTGATFAVTESGAWTVTATATDLDIRDLTSVSDSISAICSGSVAHDSEDVGSPIKIGAKAVNMDGTVPGTAVAENDRANNICDLYGRLLTETTHPNFWSACANYSEAQTATEIKAAPGAGLSLYITDVVVSNGAVAGNVKFVEDTAAAADKIEVMYFAINGGAALHFRTPIKLTANKNFGITSVTCTTHSVTINGYTAP